MRWFKHLTRAHLDEQVTALIHEDGLEAYGFYWMLLEIIAESMDATGRCELTHTLPQWSHLCYSHHHRVGKYLGKLGVRGLVTVRYEGGRVTVSCPNLLKYRDEYTKKSGECQESVRSKRQKQNIDTEADTENPPRDARVDVAPDLGLELAPAEEAPQLSVVPPRKKAKRSSVEIEKALGAERLGWWKDFWGIYPCHEDKRAAMDAFERTVRDSETWAKVRAGAVRYRGKAEFDPEMKLKFGQGWINGERWEDESTRARASPTAIDPVAALMQKRIDEGWQCP